MAFPKNINKLSDFLWEFPKSYKEGMLVPARIYATERLLSEMDETVYEQLTNVAKLPGIINYALCMPDAHSGYGFPIGGVAAMHPEEGVISPGGIGFDINCGMRLVTTNLTFEEVAPRIKELVDKLFWKVPSGVGGSGQVRISKNEFARVAVQGAKWCVSQGLGWKQDLECTEEGGCIEGADISAVSEKAFERGFKQLGTLGSGNHYLEIQVVKPQNIFDAELARQMGIYIPHQIVVMFHSGSRGFGHQIATDYMHVFLKVMPQYGIKIPDRELACAPFKSPEGKAYFAAMKCAVNMAFANRQVILHRVREVFSEVFGRTPEKLGMHQVYDVAHNIAKLEEHTVNGRQRQVLVHRKGSTRSFAPGMADIPTIYQTIGQPVIIGGSMETGSYLMVGTSGSAETFYSTAHGSGRAMSRHQARRMVQGDQLQRQMAAAGIYVHSGSHAGLAEEAGLAYKDIDQVIQATECAGLSRKAVRFIPVGNVKG